MISESIVPMGNEDLLRIESLQQLNDATLSRFGVLMQTLIFEVQKSIGRRFKTKMLPSLQRLESSHPDERRRIHEARVRGAAIGHDHSVQFCASHRLECHRSAASENFIVRMRRKHHRSRVLAEVSSIVRRPPQPTSKKSLGESFAG
jgi:hypothetical protein